MKLKTYLPLKRYLALATLAMPTLVGCTNCDCGGWLRHRNNTPCTIEVPCFGFHSTCWQRWPDECVNCPSPYDPAAHAPSSGPGLGQPAPDTVPPVTGAPTPPTPAPDAGVTPPAPKAPAVEAPPEAPVPDAPKPGTSSRTIRSLNMSDSESQAAAATSSERLPSSSTSSRNVSLPTRERITKSQSSAVESIAATDAPKRVLLASEPAAKLQIATRTDWADESDTSESPTAASTPAPLPDALPESMPENDCEEETDPCEAPMPCELPGISQPESEKVSRIFLPFGIRR